ncbi:Protein of unknown function [Pyronema omphalodes CBS 100304]|uniref:Uncharacterized protein n=1 Tax=Pyronema omphalodes (strain CBS 100304) TaxID=1076935 RepID=U4LMF3_PYROM|nr:Protein of unknown function [Pyronema omphalodes CBS 100304]
MPTCFLQPSSKGSCIIICSNSHGRTHSDPAWIMRVFVPAPKCNKE